jgi:hypothetical protein
MKYQRYVGEKAVNHSRLGFSEKGITAIPQLFCRKTICKWRCLPF